jgi:hypothetical protein
MADMTEKHHALIRDSLVEGINATVEGMRTNSSIDQNVCDAYTHLFAIVRADEEGGEVRAKIASARQFLAEGGGTTRQALIERVVRVAKNLMFVHLGNAFAKGLRYTHDKFDGTDFKNKLNAMNVHK